MNFNGSGENLFCFRKSYKFCSSISNTKHVWFLCWKHSNARTKLNSSAFSWLRRDSIDTSIWPWRAYDGWFFKILIATISLVPRFQHLTTCPNVPRPKNSSTCNEKKIISFVFSGFFFRNEINRQKMNEVCSLNLIVFPFRSRHRINFYWIRNFPLATMQSAAQCKYMH